MKILRCIKLMKIIPSYFILIVVDLVRNKNIIRRPAIRLSWIIRPNQLIFLTQFKKKCHLNLKILDSRIKIILQINGMQTRSFQIKYQKSSWIFLWLLKNAEWKISDQKQIYICKNSFIKKTPLLSSLLQPELFCIMKTS